LATAFIDLILVMYSYCIRHKTFLEYVI
jgi:hypothetical protein